MIPYPAVTVHGLEQAIMALAPGRPVALLSGPDAALYAGCGWWLALIEAARAQHPQTATIDILDCADAPGRAVEALRAGCRSLVLHPAVPAFASIAAIAAQTGARLLDARPASLDISDPRAATRLRDWLG